MGFLDLLKIDKRDEPNLINKIHNYLESGRFCEFLLYNHLCFSLSNLCKIFTPRKHAGYHLVKLLISNTWEMK